MRIRRATPADAVGICAVHQRSVRALAKDDYAPERIEAWVGNRRPEHYAGAMQEQGEVMFVAERNDGRIVGFSSRRGDEVRAVYVAPEMARQGVGRTLLRAVEEEAGRAGVRRLHLLASLNALPFYEAEGYGRQGSSLVPLPDGSALAAVVMAKELD